MHAATCRDSGCSQISKWAAVALEWSERSLLAQFGIGSEQSSSSTPVFDMDEIAQAFRQA